MKRLITVTDEFQAEMIMGLLRKQGIHSVKKVSGLGGGSFGYSAFTVDIYVGEGAYKAALNILSMIDEGVSDCQEDDLVQFPEDWKPNPFDFGWKSAPADVRAFVLEKEQEKFKNHMIKLSIGWGLMFLFAYIMAGLYKNIESESSQSYFFITVTGVFILFFLIPRYRRRFQNLSKQNIKVCYGNCVGKVYDCTRYSSHFSVDVSLDNGNLLKNVSAEPKLSKEAEYGDRLLLVNVNGPGISPDPEDEVDEVYLSPFKEEGV